MTDPLLSMSTRSFPASLTPLPFHRNLRNLPRVTRPASDGRDLAVRPHDARVVGSFGYRHLTAVERSASVVAALLLLGLLSVPRGPWHRAAFVVRNASKTHWIWVCLSVLWFLGSAYLSIFAFKIWTVMLLAKPKLLEPHKILPSAFSVIRELPGNVAIHLLRKEAAETAEIAQAEQETLPVICFHGFGANASSYEDSLELLSAKLNALVLCPDQVGFGLTRRPQLRIDGQLLRNDICPDFLHPDLWNTHPPGDKKHPVKTPESLTALQTYTLSGNAVIAGSVLNAEHCISNKILIIGHSMGAITAAALAVNKARSGSKVNLVLESPAFLSKPSSSLKSSKIGLVKGLLLRLQRRILRVVLQVPGFTYSRLFWQRGLAVATRQLDKEAAERQVLRYRWPSLSENWALGLANFVTARLITMEDALVLHELIEASLEFSHLRVLIITGDQDRVVPLARSKFLQKLLQCDLQIMEGCGHIAHEEDPVTFADHVAHFAAGNVAADSVDSVDAG